MSYFDFILPQKIGIYYKDADWAEDIFYEIKDYYGMDLITYITNSRSHMRIELKDKTIIKFVKASDSCRGECFSKIIMQPNIDKEIIDCCILPTLKHQNRRAIILENNDKFSVW